MYDLVRPSKSHSRHSHIRPSLSDQYIYIPFLPITVGGLLATRARKRIRQNAAIIWGVLAERLAGEISLSLFQDSVCDCLLQGLRMDADVSVRLFSLIALEKFALTGEDMGGEGRCVCICLCVWGMLSRMMRVSNSSIYGVPGI